VTSLEGVSPSISYYSGTFTTAAQLVGQTPLPGAPSSVGAYTVVAHFAGSNDYSAADSLLVNFAITPAMPTVALTGALATAAVVAGLNGSAAASLEGVSPTITYYSGTFTTAAQFVGQTPLPAAPTAPGSYTAMASFAGSQDYSAAVSLPINFSIAPPAPVVPPAPPTTPPAPTPSSVPQLFLPGPQQLIRNGSLFLHGIGIADAADNSGLFTITLHVSRGSLRLRSAAGLSSVVGAGSSSLTLTGTLSALNRDLDSLIYTAARLFVGTVTLQVGVEDLTNSGAPLASGTLSLKVINLRPGVTLHSLAALHYHISSKRTLLVNTHRDLPRAFHDPDGDPLRFSLVRKPAPSTGRVQVLKDGSFRFTPAPGFVGTTSLVVRTFDGIAYSKPLLVLISVD
jgi:hypothetical protein